MASNTKVFIEIKGGGIISILANRDISIAIVDHDIKDEKGNPKIEFQEPDAVNEPVHALLTTEADSYIKCFLEKAF
ncbi:MAG: hypothetical protein IM613_20820 [Cytophagales bacterium]|nr:hypothetical protein [Cytophagales bacterium]